MPDETLPDDVLIELLESAALRHVAMSVDDALYADRHPEKVVGAFMELTPAERRENIEAAACEGIVPQMAELAIAQAIARLTMQFNIASA